MKVPKGQTFEQESFAEYSRRRHWNERCLRPVFGRGARLLSHERHDLFASVLVDRSLCCKFGTESVVDQ